MMFDRCCDGREQRHLANNSKRGADVLDAKDNSTDRYDVERKKN